MEFEVVEEGPGPRLQDAVKPQGPVPVLLESHLLHEPGILSTATEARRINIHRVLGTHKHMVGPVFGIALWWACRLTSPSTVPPGSERPPALDRALRAALDGDEARWVNRLARSQSPYLRSHATNPVDWYEWTDEALSRAQSEGRLIFLSVGYHTCHWCHVMAHESFEDELIAKFLNEHFVSIKVDREQRPDLDEVYMAAVHQLGGRGGWPLTAILTPDGKPLFATTYLPPRDGLRGRKTGLITVLRRFVALWSENPGQLEAYGAALARRIAQRNGPSVPADVPGTDQLDRAMDALLAEVDPVYAGFGDAPKFPTPTKLDLLLTEATRRNDPDLREPVLAMLRAMARGGIHDVLAGGFHRYATDRAWRVPHFEKMLYDNAQLVATFARATAVTDDPELRWVTARTAAFLVDELALPEGPFIAALDADSLDPDGHLTEGAFYTFTPDEVRLALPAADVDFALARYGIVDDGPLEGRSVLRLAELTPPPWSDAQSQRVRAALTTYRATRPPPSRDDLVVVAWNALAISGLLEASRVLGEARFHDAAVRAAEALLTGADDPSVRLRRTWHASARAEAPLAMLEDEAHAAVAALDLFGATGDPKWLAVARARVAVVDRHFADPSGGWFRSPDDGEALLHRPKPRHEGVEPSGAATALEAHLRLAHLEGRSPSGVDDALKSFAAALNDRPTTLPAVLEQLARRHDDRTEVVVVWPDGAQDRNLRNVLARHDLPHAARWTGPGSALAVGSAVPWLEGKVPRDDRATAYVCTNGVCQFPVTEASDFDAAIRALRSPGRTDPPPTP